ncbi:MAG: FUSC family protein [Rubrobacteraceae bacterium]
MGTSVLAGMKIRDKVPVFRRRIRHQLLVALARLQTGGGHIVQKAVAAGGAWWLASALLGHQSPAFAAIAAIISLGAAAGKEGRQAVELIIGVAFGLAVADLLLSATGAGALQVGVVVALATAVAILFSGKTLLVNEAAISALLLITLAPPSSGLSPDRFLDALIGSAAALAIRAVSPNNPRRTVARAARPIFEEMRAVLQETAGALRSADLVAAEETLRRARELDARVTGLKEALDASYGSTRLHPPRRRALGELGLYANAADQLDLAVRNVRVLARAAVTIVREGRTPPEHLPDTILELSQSVGALAAYLEDPEHPVDTRRFALEAADGATATLRESSDLETSMLVGQVRSTAVDLLRASGMDPDTSLNALHEAVGHPTKESPAPTG